MMSRERHGRAAQRVHIAGHSAENQIQLLHFADTAIQPERTPLPATLGPVLRIIPVISSDGLLHAFPCNSTCSDKASGLRSENALPDPRTRKEPRLPARSTHSPTPAVHVHP